MGWRGGRRQGRRRGLVGGTWHGVQPLAGLSGLRAGARLSGLPGGGGRNLRGSASPGRGRAKGARVTSGQSRGRSGGSSDALHEGASQDRGVCVLGDLVTPGTAVRPSVLSGAPSGAPGSAISGFLESLSFAYHIFIHKKHGGAQGWGREEGRSGSARGPRVPRVRAAAGAREQPAGAPVPRERVHARVGRHTRPAVLGQLRGRIRSVCGEGGRERAGKRAPGVLSEGERVPERVPGPRARGGTKLLVLSRRCFWAASRGDPGLSLSPGWGAAASRPQSHSELGLGFGVSPCGAPGAGPPVFPGGCSAMGPSGPHSLPLPFSGCVRSLTTFFFFCE